MNRVPFSAERGPSGKTIWKPLATGNASQKVAPAATRPTANSTRSRKSKRSVSKRSNASTQLLTRGNVNSGLLVGSLYSSARLGVAILYRRKETRRAKRRSIKNGNVEPLNRSII